MRFKVGDLVGVKGEYPTYLWEIIGSYTDTRNFEVVHLKRTTKGISYTWKIFKRRYDIFCNRYEYKIEFPFNTEIAKRRIKNEV